MTTKDSQVVPLRSADIIDSEAADWLTLLDRGDLSKKDRQALKQWLAQGPEHAVALNNMATMWREMDFVLNDQHEEAFVSLPFWERFTVGRTGRCCGHVFGVYAGRSCCGQTCMCRLNTRCAPQR